MEDKDFVVVQVGRWKLHESGEWEFKIDKSRQGRCLRISTLLSKKQMEVKIRELYGVESISVDIEMTYWAEDKLCRLSGLGISPTKISGDRGFRAFKSISMADKSVNLFVCFDDTYTPEKQFKDPLDIVVSLKPKRTRVVAGKTPHSFGCGDNTTAGNNILPTGRNDMLELGLGIGVQNFSEPIKEVVEKTRKGCGFEIGGSSSTSPRTSSVQLGTVGLGLSNIWESQEDDNIIAGVEPSGLLNESQVSLNVGIDLNTKPIVRRSGIRTTSSALSIALDTHDSFNEHLLAHMEATEAEIMASITSDGGFGRGSNHSVGKELSDGEVHGQSVFSEDEGEEESDEEELDYQFENWDYGEYNEDEENVQKGDSDMDDFVDPPKKKFKSKLKNVLQSKRLTKVILPIEEQFKKGLSLTEVYGYEDIEPMFGDEDEDALAAHVDLTKEDDAMFVGRTFATREDFKTALSIYAINRVFRFKITRFDSLYLVAQCIAKDQCDWRVYAHQVGLSEEYEVKKANLHHSCTVEARGQFSKHATSKVVAALLRSKYANAYCAPRARDLPDSILQDHHLHVTYWKAWKIKELAVASAQGTEESSYRLLPLYLHLLQLANPGTVYYLETELDELGDDRFKYCYFALGASVQGLPYCRRVVVIDGTHLHGKYKGCLLTASFQDANFQIFPIAFAIVDGETDEAWTWFLEKLSETVYDGDDLTIVSDRAQSIYAGISAVYTQAHHGACLVHVMRNVKSKYKKGMSSLVWRAGSQFRVKGFKEVYARIKRRNLECWKFLELIGVQHWSRAYFKGSRYNLMSSNIAESLNKALLPCRDSPVVAMIEFIRKMLARWFDSRRKRIQRTVGDIPIGVEKQLLVRLKNSVGLSVMAVGRWDYEVGNDHDHVSLEAKTCTCLEFQELKIPCKHAMAAATLRKLEYRTLVGLEHRISTWAPTVEGLILPVRDPSEVEVPEEIRVMCLMPPKTRRPPGRPPKVRIPSTGEYEGNNKSMQPNRCGRCRRTGHNRVTCTAPIGG